MAYAVKCTTKLPHNIVIIFSALHTLYVCMCITYSTSYLNFNKLVDPWNVCMYVCVYVYVCVYYVCIYVFMRNFVIVLCEY